MLGARRVHLVAALVVGRRFRIMTLARERTYPRMILSDNGTELTSNAILSLAAGAWRRVALHRTRETDASTVSETEEVSSPAALTHRCHFERILRKRPQKFGLP
jgi:hypothetical protein